MQAEASVRLQALHAILDAALQPDSSEAITICALRFVGDQVAAVVQSSAHESEEQQAQLQQLMNTSMIMHKVPPSSPCLWLPSDNSFLHSMDTLLALGLLRLIWLRWVC